MIVMKRHAEVSVNEFGDALGGPQLVGPAMRLRSLAEQAVEFALLLEGQACRWARVWFGGESVRNSFEVEPAVDGTWPDAHDARDILNAVARVHGLNCLASSLLQGTGGSKRSAHIILYARPSETASLVAQLAVNPLPNVTKVFHCL